MQIEISRGRDPQIEPSYCADRWMDRLTRRKSVREKLVEGTDNIIHLHASLSSWASPWFDRMSFMQKNIEDTLAYLPLYLATSLPLTDT